MAKMKTKNSAYKAVDSAELASGQEFDTAKLLTSPQFFVNAGSTNDKSPSTASSIYGTERRILEVETGLQMQTDTGLAGKIFVGQSNTKVSGTSPILLPSNNNEFVLQDYGIELQLPILKNGFGRDVKLKKESIVKASEASLAYAQIDRIQLENKAFLTYLMSARLQETIKLQKILVEQGRSLVNWTQHRVDAKILENADLSQSIAAMQERELNLQTSLITFSDLQKEFNTIISEDPTENLPQLQSLEMLVPNDVIIPPRSITYRETIALSKSIQAEKANLLLQKEDYKPELNVVGKATGYTKQSETNDTTRCTSFQACSQIYFGVTLKIPLDVAATSNSIASAENKIKAKKFMVEDAQAQSGADAKKLFQKSKILKLQRDLSYKIVETQKLRLDQERKRQKYGRASAFDIIRAEQDYVESQIHRLSIIYSQAELKAQFALFEVEK